MRTTAMLMRKMRFYDGHYHAVSVLIRHRLIRQGRRQYYLLCGISA